MLFVPYTYLIGWTKHNKYYYGAEFSNRKAKIANPQNLWVSYFTSSKHVAVFREKYGEPDIIQVRKTFETAKAAHTWEHKVLTRIDAACDERFLNQHNAGYKFCCIKHTPETLAKMSAAQKARPPKSDSHKAKISATLKHKAPRRGVSESEETRERKRQALRLHQRSDEHQRKLNETRKVTVKRGIASHFANTSVFHFEHDVHGYFIGAPIELKHQYSNQNLSSQYLNQLSRGERRHHKGWRLRRL